MVKNTCKITPNQYQMLVYIADILPEYKVAHTKSDWTGLKLHLI